MRKVETIISKNKNGTYNVYLDLDIFVKNVIELTSKEVTHLKCTNMYFREYPVLLYIPYLNKHEESNNYVTQIGRKFNLYIDDKTSKIYICFRGEL